MTTETSKARGEVVAWMCISADGLRSATDNPNARDNYAKAGRTIRPLTYADTTPPPPAAARGDVRGLVEKVARAHEFFAANSDLRMTTGDHAARAADLRIAEHALSAALAAEGVQAGEVEQRADAFEPEHDGDTCRSNDIYAGNSVGWWKSKADNYGAGLRKVCRALGDIGVKMDGNTPCWEYVARLSQQPEARGVVDELLVNIRRSCDRARNSLDPLPQNSSLLASLDHIENLAQEARSALTEVRNG